MGTYDLMKKSLLPTGLYRLDGNTAVDWELQAYAAALDPLRDDLAKLQDESFTATAADYGLRYPELALGILWPAETTEGRRNTIFALGAVGADDFGREAFQKLLADLGITADVSEDAAKQTLTLHVKKEPVGGILAWEQVVDRFVPAQIQIVWDYAQLQPNG